MERYLCLALLLALLLATVSCPAFAETDGVVIENGESIGSDILLPDGIELEDPVVLDENLLTDLVTYDDTLVNGKETDSPTIEIQTNKSDNISLTASSISIGVKEK